MGSECIKKSEESALKIGFFAQILCFLFLVCFFDGGSVNTALLLFSVLILNCFCSPIFREFGVTFLVFGRELLNRSVLDKDQSKGEQGKHCDI